MGKRQKIELKPALKAQDYSEGDIVKATAFIKKIEDIETKYGDKTILQLDDGDSIFMNVASNNNLIEAYGEEDKQWIGKGVKIICEKDKIFNKTMLVCHAITSDED